MRVKLYTENHFRAYDVVDSHREYILLYAVFIKTLKISGRPL